MFLSLQLQVLIVGQAQMSFLRAEDMPPTSIWTVYFACCSYPSMHVIHRGSWVMALDLPCGWVNPTLALTGAVREAYVHLFSGIPFPQERLSVLTVFT